MDSVDLDKINSEIVDRSSVFYWQADRKITQEDIQSIWKDRHAPFTSDVIVANVNREMRDDPLVTLDEFSDESDTSFGNINSVRSGTLASGRKVIIRCHPVGVANGYFHVETLAAESYKKFGLPAYDTYAIHDLESSDDFAFQVISRLPGTTVRQWLTEHPDDENKIVREVGVAFGRMHEVVVKGFGPFDNAAARDGTLIGLHDTFVGAVRASLDDNLDVLFERELFTAAQRTKIDELFSDHNELLHHEYPVLVHNDFADWNQMTDGKTISGIIDMDEAIGSSPVSDIACWSTFFPPERTKTLLEGYFSYTLKQDNFDDLFELLRMRYSICKLTLRLRKSEWDHSDFLKASIQSGADNLALAMKYFSI